jgi:ABC-2 type transport system permease protein
MFAIFRYSLSRFRGQILGWGISLALMAAIMTRFYDTIAAQKDNYMKLLDNYPKEMLAFFGTSDVMQMFTPSGYLNLEFFSYMTVIIGIFSVLAGSGLLAGDEESGTLDLVLAHPVSRTALFVGRSLAFLIATIAILAITWLGFILSTPGTMMTVTAGQMALPLLALFGILMLFGGLSLLLSLLMPSRRMAAMTSAILMVASYFINSLSMLSDKLKEVAKILPFKYYQGGLAIDGLKWEWLAGMLAFSVLFVLIAWWRFERRDIRVGGEGGWRIPGLSLRSRPKAVAG